MDYEIQDENDLQYHLMKNYRLGEFAKVNRISTIEISPDIDSLEINESQKLVIGYEFKLLKYRKNWKKVDFYPMYQGIGQALSYFNFGVDKSYLVLGLSKEIPAEILSQTVKKIEETITMFNVLKSFIVGTVERMAEKIGELQGVTERILSDMKRMMSVQIYPASLEQGLSDIQAISINLLQALSVRSFSGIGYFGVMVWVGHDDLLRTELRAEVNFPTFANEDLNHKKECLLRKEFRYDRDFIKKNRRKLTERKAK
jgi:hypothetical protein